MNGHSVLPRRRAAEALELTEIVDTWVSDTYGDRDEHHDRGSSGTAPPGDPAACGGGHGQRSHDVPLLRDQPAELLRVEAPLRRAGAPTGSGTVHVAPRPARRPLMWRWSARSCTCARTTTSGRPRSRCTWPATTTSTISPSGVWRILKRLDLNRLPGLAALQAPRPPVEALREAAARPPGPDRREVHRPHRRRPRRKHYQFTAIDDCTRLRVLRIYPRFNQKTAIQFADYVLEKLPVPASRRSRRTTGPSSARRSTTTCSTRASATATSSPAPPGSTARWRDPTASTPKSSTGSSTAP